MAEEKTRSPKYMIRDTLGGFLTAVILGTIFHYISYIAFSLLDISIFTAFGTFLGFLNGITRTQYHTVQTEKSKMQASFGEIEFSLKKSARQYKALLDGLTDAVYQVNEQGRLVYFNQAMMLLTGYTVSELKLMKMDQIQVKNEKSSHEAISFLDNNIYRHNERWRFKDGHFRTMEISTRLIQSGARMYELNVARDSKPVSNQSHEILPFTEMQKWMYGRLTDEAGFRKRFFHQLQQTLNGFSSLFNQYVKDVSGDNKEVIKVLTDWKRTRNLLQLFMAKNVRDLHSSISYWDLNEVLLQELSMLKTSMDTGKVSILVQFGSNLQKVKATGMDLTLAFSVLLRSISQAVVEAGGGQLQVFSNMTTDSLFIEVQAKPVKNYLNHFQCVLQSATMDLMVPFPNPKELPHQFFSTMKMSYDAIEESNMLIVKLRLPFEKKMLDEKFGSTPKDKGQEPSKAREYVVL